MPDDPLIRATTTIDVTGAKAGLAVLKEEYRQASTDVRQSVQRVVDAEKQATEAIAAGHAQLGAVLQKAAAEERSALDSLISKQLELKSALDQASVAQSHQVSQMAAASGTIRVFEGALPIRAVENFATKTLGLGPILQAAFPVIGAIALGEALARVYEKTNPLIEAEKELAENTKKNEQEFRRLQSAIERLQIQQLTAEMGKAAGMRLASFYAGSSALEDQRALDTTNRKIEEVAVKIAKWEAVNKLIGTAPGGNAFASAEHFFGLGNADLKTKMEGLLNDQLTLTLKLKEFSQQRSDDEARAGKDAAEAAKAAAREATAAYRQKEADLRHADEEQLSELKANHQLSVGEIIQFWKARLAAESGYTDRVREIQNTLGNLYQESDKVVAKIAEHGEKLQEAAAKKAAKQVSFLALMAVEATDIGEKMGAQISKAETQLDDLKTKGAEEASLGGLDQKKLEIQRTSTLNPYATNSDKVSELQQLRDIEAQKAAIQIAAEQSTATRLKQQYGEKSDEYQRQANRVVQIQQQADQKLYADTTKILAQQQAQYRQYFEQLYGAFTASINSMIMGQKTFMQAVQQAWSSIASAALQDIEKIAEKWVFEHVFMAIIHRVFGDDVATDQDSQIAKTSTTNVAMATSDAAVAAAGTFAYYSFINPLIAPGMAGAAYAEGLTIAALAAFETGTSYVPSTGVALIHKGERIIDAQSNQQITQALAGGSGGGGLTMNGDIHVHDSATPRQTAGQLLDQIYSEMGRRQMLPLGAKRR